MKAFIYFDFNWYHTDQGEQVGQKINQYADRDAQLKIGDKVLVFMCSCLLTPPLPSESRPLRTHDACPSYLETLD